MYARVIEIGRDIIYLEIDDQIRFCSAYQIQCKPRRIAKDDSVDFVFGGLPGQPSVLIQRVVRRSPNQPQA